MIFPQGFLNSLVGCNGFDLNDFVEAHTHEGVISIRMNEAKINHLVDADSAFSSIQEGIFNSNNIKGKVPWSNAGKYLKKRPSFTLDPLFHAGLYYVQEASSMFIEHIIRVSLPKKQTMTALDLCASPGGKTTLLASLPNFRLVLANEIIQTRVGPLFENVVKWGAPHVFVSNNDPKDFAKLGQFFDLVLVDAPCSGSGLFRKDPHAREMWNDGLVEFCSLRQKRILGDAVNVLADNGYLLYSTCSFSHEENEMNLDHLVEAYGLESVKVEVPDNWGVVESQSTTHKAFGYRFYPGKLDGEGFFCALLKKTSSNGRVGSVSKGGVQQSYKCNIGKWLENSSELFFSLYNDDLFAVQANLIADVAMFQQALHLKKSGVRMGAMIRGELNPDHELAMSLLGSSQIKRQELTLEQALVFLKKEKLDIPFEEKGWIIMTYMGAPLGWLKAMEGRSNNYYPKNWRITMRS